MSGAFVCKIKLLSVLNGVLFIYNILYLSPVEAIKQKFASDSQKTKKGEIEDTATENYQFLKSKHK